MAAKGKYKDISEKKYGKLTVVKCIGKIGGYYNWECLCDCGNCTSVPINNLNSGHTRSCGCYNAEKLSERSTHGHSKNDKRSPEYIAWSAMKSRCMNPDNTGYDKYGGRGIEICDSWLHSFENFLKDMGNRPKGTTLDRFPNNETGHYGPENCRWATPKQQADNRRSSRWYEYKGIRMVLEDWARKIGVDSRKLSYYLKNHSFEDTYRRYTKSKSNFIQHTFGYII